IPHSLLVVDDSKLGREMLATQLERQGYQVVSVANGKEALELIRQQAFDLVLLDVEMPEMNGLELLAVIRGKYSVADLPVIMVTGRDQTEDMVAPLRRGATDYTVKPFTFPVVRARVKTQLAMKKVRAGAAVAPPPTPAAPVLVAPALPTPSAVTPKPPSS